LYSRMKRRTISTVMIITILIIAFMNAVRSQRAGRRSNLGRAGRRAQDGFDSGLPTREGPSRSHPSQRYGDLGDLTAADYERQYVPFIDHNAANWSSRTRAPPTLNREGSGLIKGTHGRWGGRSRSLYGYKQPTLGR